MDLGVHLPLLALGDAPLSWRRLSAVAETAGSCGFAALAANDHLVYQRPWLDGPTALAAVVGSSEGMTLATTAALAVVREPVALAKALAALHLLSEGRLVAALAPGSSPGDYAAVGLPFAERWARFDAAVGTLRERLAEDPPPLWLASWGSPAGLRRVAAAGDGWLASAYNTTPERFAAARAWLEAARGPAFPNALATMWLWVSEDRADVERRLAELGALLGRPADELRDRVCVGSPEHCAHLLARYAEAGCRRVYVWPLGDERRQLERVAAQVVPRLAAARVSSSSMRSTAGPR